ncbi:hypothetical protein GOODEAATRI_014338 [Goodea atripinnis]|uniref:Uncharacterized protein n=1 Tax=Goodea atripinnis TaxID=208336 RepID=A0ABV0PXY9_9TELE
MFLFFQHQTQVPQQHWPMCHLETPSAASMEDLTVFSLAKPVIPDYRVCSVNLMETLYTKFMIMRKHQSSQLFPWQCSISIWHLIRSQGSSHSAVYLGVQNYY